MFLRTAGLRVAVLPLSALCALTTAGLTVHYAGVLAFGFITLVAQLQLALPFADLGMGAAVARAVARADGSASGAETVRVLIRRTALLLGTVGVVGAAGAVLSGISGFWSGVFDVPEALAGEVDLVMSLVLAVFFLSLPLGIAERVLIGRDRADVLVLLGLIPSVGNLLVVLALGQLGVPVAWLALGLPLSTLSFLGLCGYLAFVHPRIGLRGITGPGHPQGAAPGQPAPAGKVVRDVTSIRLILLGGLPVLLSTAGMVLSEQHGRLVLASAGSALDLSEYAIALQLYMPIYSVLYMAATVLWPRFAVAKDPQLWRRANLMLTGLGFGAALGYLSFARPVADLVSGGSLVPSWGVVLGLSAALIAQSAHLTQVNLFTDRAGFWRQAAMSLALLGIVVPGTLLGIRLGLGAAAPGVSMALGVTLAQVIPGLLLAARLLRVAAAGSAPGSPVTRSSTGAADAPGSASPRHPNELADQTDPADQAELADQPEPADPTDPADSTEPSDPTSPAGKASTAAASGAAQTHDRFLTPAQQA